MLSVWNSGYLRLVRTKRSLLPKRRASTTTRSAATPSMMRRRPMDRRGSEYTRELLRAARPIGIGQARCDPHPGKAASTVASGYGVLDAVALPGVLRWQHGHRLTATPAPWRQGTAARRDATTLCPYRTRHHATALRSPKWKHFWSRPVVAALRSRPGPAPLYDPLQFRFHLTPSLNYK